MSRKLIVSGCYFESDESEVLKDPIVGKKSGTISEEPKLYRRKSELDNISDNFEFRMKNFHRKLETKEVREVKLPENFAVSVAYNKSGYQLIPKEDLKI